jgi:drug/metabolite transporter (DMT)-like permease
LPQITFKTRLFSAIVVIANVLGNTLLTWGMKRVGDPGLSPLLYIKAIFNPFVTLGILLLIVWMLSRMTLLSWADLSYVLPVTSAGYILQAIIGKYFFGEHISAARWSGTLLIIGGIVLVGMTSPRTVHRS